MEEDVRYKAMLPCVYCRLHDFPNSDGQLTSAVYRVVCSNSLYALCYINHRSV